MAQIFESQPKESFTLVTVHPSNEIAKEIVARVKDDHVDKFDIKFLANCTSIEDVESTLIEHKPYMLVCASLWTPEQSTEIVKIANATMPGIITHVIPHGLFSTQGTDAIVQHAAQEIIPNILL